jgi:hypothetical protein
MVRPLEVGRSIRREIRIRIEQSRILRPGGRATLDAADGFARGIELALLKSGEGS